MKKICKHCGKSYSKNGIGTHIWRAHGAGQDHYLKVAFSKAAPSWNSGLTKNDPRVKKIADAYSANIKNGSTKPGFQGKRHSQESKNKMSVVMSTNNKGGRCKWFDVDGQKVQGTWEKNIAGIIIIEKDQYEKILRGELVW